MEKKPDPIDIAIGQRICSLRVSQGKSQSDLAMALGLTFQQVQKYETGANRVSGSKLYRTALFLGVKPSFFFPDAPDDAAGDDAALPPAMRLGGVSGGHELARLFVEANKTSRDAIIGVARALNLPRAQAA